MENLHLFLRQSCLLTWRHAIMWTRRLPMFFALYITVPSLVLYGLGVGFGLQNERMLFMIPGFMVNAGAAIGFMATLYGGYMRFHLQHSYESWLAATLTLHHIVVAEALWGALRGIMVALGVGLAGSVLGGVFPWMAILATLPVVALVCVCTSLLGLALMTTARSFDDLGVYETLLTAVFVFSGVFVAISAFPQPIQWLTQLQPVYHGIALIRPLFLPETGHPLYHLGTLLGMTALAYPLAYHLFRKRLFV